MGGKEGEIRTSRASKDATAFTRGGSAEQLTRERTAARVRTLARANPARAPLLGALRAERARAAPRPCGQSVRACILAVCCGCLACDRGRGCFVAGSCGEGGVKAIQFSGFSAGPRGPWQVLSHVRFRPRRTPRTRSLAALITREARETNTSQGQAGMCPTTHRPNCQWRRGGARRRRRGQARIARAHERQGGGRAASQQQQPRTRKREWTTAPSQPSPQPPAVTNGEKFGPR